MIERNQLAVNLAQKDYYPDLSVGYMYQQRPMLPDMHGMTFTINIPVFYKSKQREEVRQATEERLSAESSRDNRKNELNFELKQQYLAAKASDELLRLFSAGRDAAVIVGIGVLDVRLSGWHSGFPQRHRKFLDSLELRNRLLPRVGELPIFACTHREHGGRGPDFDGRATG